MGSGTFFSIRYGQRDEQGLREGIVASFLLIVSLTAVINVLVFALGGHIRVFLKIPAEVWPDMHSYFWLCPLL